MGFAREIEFAPASPPLTNCRDYFGYIPAVYRAQGLLPRLLEAEIGLEAAILYRESALSLTAKKNGFCWRWRPPKATPTRRRRTSRLI